MGWVLCLAMDFSRWHEYSFGTFATKMLETTESYSLWSRSFLLYQFNRVICSTDTAAGWRKNSLRRESSTYQDKYMYWPPLDPYLPLFARRLNEKLDWERTWLGENTTSCWVETEYVSLGGAKPCLWERIRLVWSSRNKSVELRNSWKGSKERSFIDWWNGVGIGWAALIDWNRTSSYKKGEIDEAKRRDIGGIAERKGGVYDPSSPYLVSANEEAIHTQRRSGIRLYHSYPSVNIESLAREQDSYLWDRQITY